MKTDAGRNALRAAGNVVSKEMISAAKYYMGVPDGLYFEEKDFPENVVKAKKAYITLNTVLGASTAEMDRFKEGKKQIPELFTPLGVRKMLHLFMHLYGLANVSSNNVTYETVRACRQTEISEGESVVGPLTSTTKLSIDEIMDLGYGNKNGLAICRYTFHKGSVILDMEQLGSNYLKPEEREVLLLMGNRLSSRCLGYDERYKGKDGNPALIYEVDVFSPEFSDEEESRLELEKIVFKEETINEIRDFYIALNKESDFPEVPKSYEIWKECFQKLVIQELKKIS